MITPLSSEELILETERLILAPYELADLELSKALLCDPEVMRFVADPMTADAVAAHMPKAVRRGAGGRLGIWSIARKDTGTKIGDVVLLPVPIDEDEHDWSLLVPEAYPDADIELGYLFVPEAWGQGFATEVCRRLIRFVFEQTKLSELVATVEPEHVRSQNVLIKSGLRRIGFRRAFGYDDILWMKITRDEWAA